MSLSVSANRMTGPTTSIKETTRQAFARLAELRAEFADAYPDVLRRYPVEDYVHTLDKTEPLTGYWLVPALIHQWCKEIEALGGSDSLENYHKMVLLTLLADFPERI